MLVNGDSHTETPDQESRALRSNFRFVPKLLFFRIFERMKAYQETFEIFTLTMIVINR